MSREKKTTKIKKKKRIRLSLRVRLTLLVTAELVVSILLAVWLGDFLNNYIFIDWEIPLLLTLMGISLCVLILLLWDRHRREKAK